LALDRGEWSASRPGRFASRERAPGTRSIDYIKMDLGEIRNEGVEWIQVTQDGVQ